MTVSSRVVTFLSYENWKWKAHTSSPLAKISWSALRRIGQSRMLALTIVVPFLGPMLLFNEHVVEYFRLSSDFVSRWYDASGRDEAAKSLSLARLYYLYFGLTFLGCASAVFALLCPLQIKSFSSAREYLAIEGPLVTNARLGLLVSETADLYMAWYDARTSVHDEDWGPIGLKYPKWVLTIGTPWEFQTLFGVVFTRLFLDLPQETLTNLVEVDEADGDYTNHRGEPDPDKIAYAIIHGGNAYRWFAQEIQAIANGAPHYRSDMLTLQYMGLDHTKPIARLVVALFYGAGFALLLWPTLTTFARISKRAVFG